MCVLSAEKECDYSMDSLSNNLTNVSLTPSKKSSREAWIKSSSSESELSDAESHISKVKGLQSSIRQNAYIALQAVIKVWLKSFALF